MPLELPEQTVVIMAPIGRDAAAVGATLQREGILVAICADATDCLRRTQAGAGALLLTEEALELPGFTDVLVWVQAQPPWSELPLLVLTNGGESRQARLLDLAATAAGALSLLERPMSPTTLVRSVQVALRTRQRQYQVRDLMAEQARVEKQQREFQAELERLVTERTAKLNELVGELEHFSYTITHDMRAPLRAMRGFAEIIQELLADAPQAEARTFLKQIITSAERMDLLITDALNYSRAVRQELPLAPIDVGQILEGMLETYPQFLAHKPRIQVDGPLPVILGNEAGLTQCFSNLIGNALKFVEPDKEPDVRVWAEPVGNQADANAGGPWVRIWVEDQGIGISETMLPRVFHMFARGSRKYEGTGIGLALVRKVVQRMGGRVGVQSEQGKGSRFWVELKLEKRAPRD
jgi:signal transduction histidine kinase